MISVITCPRPGGVSYSGPLLIAIDIACAMQRKFLFCDEIQETRAGWVSEFLDARERRGQRDNKYVGWMAIERAAEIGEDLLFLEDDVIPTSVESLIEAVRYEVPADCGFSSLHRSRWTTPGVHEAGKFTLSQAVKFPHRSLVHLVNWRRICSGDWDAVVGVDTAFAAAGHGARWKYEQTERNYFNHVGEISAVRNGADGRSVAF